VAIVTGANHGIGAATARALAAVGARVVVTYLRTRTAASDLPETYVAQRAGDATAVVQAIRAIGGVAEAIEADLRDPETPRAVFDAAEAAFGPVEILVNNASGWVGDSFRSGLQPDSVSQVFEVDARGSALMIAEVARRHMGPHHRPDLR